jgi:hypothetical protein
MLQATTLMYVGESLIIRVKRKSLLFKNPEKQNELHSFHYMLKHNSTAENKQLATIGR